MVKKCFLCDHQQDDCSLFQRRANWTTIPTNAHVCVCHFPGGSYSVAGRKAQAMREIMPEPSPERIRGLSENVTISKNEYVQLTEAKIELENLKTKLESILTDEQQQILLGNHTTQKFTSETLMKSIGIKLFCGNNGYNYMRDLGYPLPHLRTLQKHMNSFEMLPGYLYEIGSILNKATESFDANDNHAILLFDEMVITQKLEYNPTLRFIMGRVSEEVSKDEAINSLDPKLFLASKVLVFMIKFVQTSVKQVIGYYFTNSHIDNDKLANVVKNLVRDIEKDSGTRIHGILSEAAGQNTALFNKLLNTDKDLPSNTSVPHFSDPSRKIFLLYDNAHNIKNLKNAFAGQGKIYFPDWFNSKQGITEPADFSIFREAKALQDQNTIAGTVRMLIIIKNVEKLYFNEISTFLAKVCEVYGERT